MPIYIVRYKWPKGKKFHYEKVYAKNKEYALLEFWGYQHNKAGRKAFHNNKDVHAKTAKNVKVLKFRHRLKA